MESNLPLDVHLIVSHKDGMPCLEIRRSTKDLEAIKNLVSCAFNNTPIIVMPTFTNRIKAMGSLIEKGIIYKEGEEYRFCF